MKFENIFFIYLIGIILIIGIYEYIYRLIKVNKNRNERIFMIRTNFIDFINFIFIKIPLYLYQFLISLVTIVTFPINLLRILAEEFDYLSLKEKYTQKVKLITIFILNHLKKNLIKAYKGLKTFIKTKMNTKNFIQKQLDIYYDCIGTYIQEKNLREKNGSQGYLITTIIFLLQFGISFPTTLAGANLIFSSVSKYAPIVFTFIVQGLIVIFSNKAFEKNKRSKLMKGGLWISVVVSVFFSYTGIVVGQESPFYQYRKSYEVYEKTFNELKQSLLNEVDKEKQKNDLESLLSNLNLYYENIKSTRDNLKQSMNENDLSNRNYVYTYIDPETGERHQGFNTELFNAIQGLKKEELQTEMRISTLDRYIEEFEKLFDNLGEEETNYGEKINTYFNSLTNKDEQDNEEQGNNEQDNGENDNSGEITTSLLNNLISYSNTFKETYKLDDLTAIESSIVDKIIENLLLNSNISKINIKTDDDLFGYSSKNEDNKKPFLKIYEALKDKKGFENNMMNLANLRADMRYNVATSYEKISTIIENNEILNKKYKEQSKKLETYKDNVLEQPSIFSYSLDTFNQKNSDKRNYLIMFIIALLIDVGSALLGLVNQRRKDSFIYIKTSKDYFNEYDDIFEIIFMSLMRNFEVKVKQGQFTSINLTDYQNNCMTYAVNTAQIIRDFLNEFELSEATYKLGFNLRCQLDKDHLKKYNPLISILLKTNLLKIVSYQQYENLMKKYFPEINDVELQKSKPTITNKNCFYLLLRNRGENYLRENIPFQYIIDDKIGGENDE